MQAETQNQPAAVPENTALAESVESKRGGKRPGAGRKPNLAKRLLKDHLLACLKASARKRGLKRWFSCCVGPALRSARAERTGFPWSPPRARMASAGIAVR